MNSTSSVRQDASLELQSSTAEISGSNRTVDEDISILPKRRCDELRRNIGTHITNLKTRGINTVEGIVAQKANIFQKLLIGASILILFTYTPPPGLQWNIDSITNSLIEFWSSILENICENACSVPEKIGLE